jgi:hypothetical protein
MTNLAIDPADFFYLDGQIDSAPDNPDEAISLGASDLSKEVSAQLQPKNTLDFKHGQGVLGALAGFGIAPEDRAGVYGCLVGQGEIDQFDKKGMPIVKAGQSIDLGSCKNYSAADEELGTALISNEQGNRNALAAAAQVRADKESARQAQANLLELVNGPAGKSLKEQAQAWQARPGDMPVNLKSATELIKSSEENSRKTSQSDSARANLAIQDAIGQYKHVPYGFADYYDNLLSNAIEPKIKGAHALLGTAQAINLGGDGNTGMNLNTLKNIVVGVVDAGVSLFDTAVYGVDHLLAGDLHKLHGVKQALDVVSTVGSMNLGISNKRSGTSGLVNFKRSGDGYGYDSDQIGFALQQYVSPTQVTSGRGTHTVGATFVQTSWSKEGGDSYAWQAKTYEAVAPTPVTVPLPGGKITITCGSWTEISGDRQLATSLNDIGKTYPTLPISGQTTPFCAVDFNTNAVPNSAFVIHLLGQSTDPRK